ncbi:AMP-binding protein [uncultured Pseudacidovorax sp.]|uniref:AMP-binding protein n=1 Tax=uncultured Pseudacidovorax sp. TaxID=679313 RepID=UPI0025CD67BE|nr:AMP-binding protein [uncultured Pseudacidovorax sp.]
MIDFRHGERPLHDYLRLHARATPDKTAIVWYGRRISYAELDDLSDRFAQSLRQRGLSQGDVLVLVLHNCPQFVIAHLGAQKLGVVVSACSPHARRYELAHQFAELDVRAVVAGEEDLPTVHEARPRGRDCPVYGVRAGDMLPGLLAMDVPACIRLPGEPAKPWPDGVVDLMDELEAMPPFEPLADLAMDEVALMACTSGTTGLPKAAMLGHDVALYKSAATSSCWGLTADDVLLADVPLHHISGLMAGLDVVLYMGATVVLLARFDAAAVLQAIEACRVTWWYTMAPSLELVMGAEDAPTYDLSSLRGTASTSFGTILTRALADRWHRFTGGAQVFEAGYGLSETHSSDVMMPADAVRWGTNGRPVPGTEVRIVDPDTGQPRPCGVVGEILLRGPQPFRGYWMRPEATAAMVRDGWVRTGDIGRLDEEGYLTFVGRRKEMIKVWSYSVFPEEVEAILATHPDVRQAAVVGLPDPDRGEALQAYVVLKDPAARQIRVDGFGRRRDRTDQVLIEWCQAHMSHYKVPRTIVFRDGLPAADNGKLLRRMLREPGFTAPRASGA